MVAWDGLVWLAGYGWCWVGLVGMVVMVGLVGMAGLAGLFGVVRFNFLLMFERSLYWIAMYSR